MKVTTHKQGAPCWFELAASDEAAAVEFYGALFGWQDEARPMSDGGAYHMQTVEGDVVAAISRQQPDEAQMGVPPHWSIYLAVDSVDVVAGKVEANGGAILAAPFDVMEAGRMAVIADPTGGAVCLWEGKGTPGAARWDEPGAPAWAELATREPERAADFFAALLGVEVTKSEMPGGGLYIVLKVDGEDVAGIFPITPEMGEMPSAWGAYFGAADVDASAERAQSLGATMVMPPTDIPGGRFSVLMDPQQVPFGLYQAS
jgi:uncharacterized protein